MGRPLSRQAQGQGPDLCREGRSRLRHALGQGPAIAAEPLISKTQPYAKKIAHRGIWVEPSLLAEIEYRVKSAESKVRHTFSKGIREDLRSCRVFELCHHRVDVTAPFAFALAREQLLNAPLKYERLWHLDLSHDIGNPALESGLA
jgi:hypothetical protein